MALQSMTGFARASESIDGVDIAWELKSVNGKSLDARVRLPQGMGRLELQVKRAVQARFKRGNIQAGLTITAAETEALPVVNHVFLKQVSDLANDLVTSTGCAPATADGLLAIRGVLVTPEGEQDDEKRKRRDASILKVLEDALDRLVEARRAEGKALLAVLSRAIGSIEALTSRAEGDPSRSVEAIRQRLANQLAALMEAGSGLDESRLHMEAALLATKADIREEIDRLNAHVENARAMLGEGGAVGRQLDFLAQEFNRESNTLCSKSNAASLSSIGLELKAVVDQFREQIQNLE